MEAHTVGISPEVLYVDEEPHNADWAKRTWDLPFDNLADLRAYLSLRGITPEQFRRLPVYQLNLARKPWLKGL